MRKSETHLPKLNPPPQYRPKRSEDIYYRQLLGGFIFGLIVFGGLLVGMGL